MPGGRIAMINLEIDGKAVEVKEGSTVMDAATQLGVYVPHFCYHKKLSIAANCRMCLVEVEKAPKPLPACATPATEGMKVSTRSQQAKTAQKGVMEFLLINHPLDCPICDQGGECQLQDLAVGYGGSESRYKEAKRVVPEKELGPLISAAEMSRCIHCTRCVRFGQEVAGVMELGMAGRGEHSEIMSFVGSSVDSELSGNMIDVCPVGALTSKPFRYSARTWELARRKTVGAHDSLGSNLVAQVKGDRVVRVVPLENEKINECWISDRDRFSYEGLSSNERLEKPMVKTDGQWREVDWASALEAVKAGLENTVNAHGPEALAGIVSPQATTEEVFMLKQLLKAFGSSKLDHRLRQLNQEDLPNRKIPWLGVNISELDRVDRFLIVGSNLRKESPLLAHRVRRANKERGAEVSVINSIDTDLLLAIKSKRIVNPSQISVELGRILVAVLNAKNLSVPNYLSGIESDAESDATAQSLLSGERKLILLGSFSLQQESRPTIEKLAMALATQTGATVGFILEGANSMGAELVSLQDDAASSGSALQGKAGAFILLHAEPELDCARPKVALDTMKAADFVVALSPYKHRATEYADVLLPISPFTETGGIFFNMEGRQQKFGPVAKPLGDTRPAWKVLRALGSICEKPNFDYQTLEDVRRDIPGIKDGIASDLLLQESDYRDDFEVTLSQNVGGIERVAEVPMYSGDSVVRRASALQSTREARAPIIQISAAMQSSLNLPNDGVITVKQNGAEITAPFSVTPDLPESAIRIPLATSDTISLDNGTGFVEIGPLKNTEMAQ
ncbi:MAG: NADH-quinone oxidoreductase subunit NuoG [Burkholderiales bacterium]